MKTTALCLLATISVLCSPVLAGEKPDLAAEVGRLAKPLIEGRQVNALTIGVIRDGKRHYFGFGAIGEDGTPAGDTVYEIGSITKVFTAYLLADMVREGLVRLDQQVRELLPKGTKVPKVGEREITLIDLATHRSGLPRMPTNFAPKDPKNPYADYDEKRLFEYLATARLASKPGERVSYSNLGMALLGRALARKAGTTYEKLLAERIVKPLKLTSTAITLTDDMKKRLAPGHNADLEPESNWDLGVMAGAGAIRSTADEMLTFLAAHFEVKDGVPDMKLAWQKGKMPGSFWHNGQTGGYHSMGIVVPEKRLAVIVLADTATGSVDGLGSLVLRVLAGEKVETPKIPRAIDLDEKVLEPYVGRYRFGPSMEIEVTRDGKKLYAQVTGQPKFRIYAESESTFFFRVAPAKVVFERNEEGKVVRLVVHQGGKQTPAVRL